MLAENQTFVKQKSSIKNYVGLPERNRSLKEGHIVRGLCNEFL